MVYEFVDQVCCVCGIHFGLTQEYMDIKQRAHENQFRCPNGHILTHSLDHRTPDDLRKENAELRLQVIQLTSQLDQIQAKLEEKSSHG